ncbi:galactokinase [Pseudobdellovibrio exovorus]|uniref:Galactokinase n=1 Tax=Pseudobdellovibrio exovorus JSS TaxID=1184267 RepID=M4VPJ2_9BACT|nr:galactokinase [Pseudobdellovibrio exovorus]AGH95039.1 galactokinase [Pseudobdellovibrio exovorus JSS]
MLNSVKFKSPTRVDLSGGTLDMWPLFNFTNNAVTINLAIDIWTTCEVHARTDSQLKIKSLDLNKEWTFADAQSFFESTDSNIKLYQAILSAFRHEILNLKTGFELQTQSQSPIGGGLGGSSSLTISMLKALGAFLQLPKLEVNEIVHLAHNLEAKLLRTPTGTQDYYPAVTGGLSFIDYNEKEISQEVLSLDGTPFAENFLLVYTGRSHHSGLNNFEVLKSAVEGDAVVLEALNEIKSISEELREVIRAQRWAEIPALFKREYNARIRLTPAFSSPEIEKLSEICLAAGAQAVKICGAGGGGCVLVWVSPDFREKVVSACQKEKFQCLNAKPINPLTE